MKILVHFHFSFLLKIENDFTPFFKIQFSFFSKNKNEDFSISFFKFSKKKWNWKWKKIEILWIHFLIFFRFFLLPLLFMDKMV